MEHHLISTGRALFLRSASHFQVQESPSAAWETLRKSLLVFQLWISECTVLPGLIRRAKNWNLLPGNRSAPGYRAFGRHNLAFLRTV
jgi:hypothetical protein